VSFTGLNSVLSFKTGEEKYLMIKGTLDLSMDQKAAIKIEKTGVKLEDEVLRLNVLLAKKTEEIENLEKEMFHLAAIVESYKHIKRTLVEKSSIQKWVEIRSDVRNEIKLLNQVQDGEGYLKPIHSLKFTKGLLKRF